MDAAMLVHMSSIGPATRCDTAHLRWDVLKALRCIKIACDVLRCIFQHVGNFSTDFGISQHFIVQFPIGLHHCMIEFFNWNRILSE